MTADEDYHHQLKACRIAGTVLLLVSAISTLGMSLKITYCTAIFESMMNGSDRIPRVTAFVMKNQTPLMGLTALVIISSLWGLWMARRLSTLIYLAGGVFAYFTVMSAVIDLGMQQPLLSLLTKFQG